MNKNEFKAEAARIGKLLGVIPTMDNYTFSDPKSPVFQIKEKELRSVVRKAKALKDPEAHGIDDIEWDFEEGYICFMLPGGFALYLSTEADMEMNEANEALNTRAVNESVNEKEFFKAFTKATGLKVSRESEVYDDRAGLVFIDAYTAARIRFGALKPGTYGEFKIKSVKPTGYRDFDVVIGYNNEDYTLRFDNAGSARTSAANAKPLADKLLKEVNAKSTAMGKLRTYCVADVDPVAYDKLKNLKAGTTFGDVIVTEVGAHPNGVYGGSPFIVEVVHPKGFAELVFRNSVALEDLKNDAKNLSSEMSEAIQYAIGSVNPMNEASEARMRKKALDIAKFFGVEIDDANGHFGFFASSAGIDKSSYDKVIKIINQTKNIEKKLGVNFIEVWSKVNSIRFNVYRSEDDIFFKLQDMNESYDHIPEYTPSAAMNEGMPSKSEALKFAQTFAKFLGIAYKESDDTWNGAGAFFEISQKGLKKAMNKIRKEQGTKQLKLGEVEMFSTGPVVEKLNVDEVEIDDQEGYIRFTKGTKDVYFQADWASDDKELLNESTVELNEVTGLPKFKTSVPSHML